MSILRFWIRLLFSLVTLLLVIAFMLRIFSPGNAETAFIFQLLQPILPWLDRACGFLTFPISFLLEKLSPWIPLGFKTWFPVSPADAFFSNMAEWFLKIPMLSQTPLGMQLRQADFSRLFPGIIDWRLVLALPLWGFIESVCMKLLIHLEGLLYRNYLRKRDGALMSGYQANPSQSSPFPASHLSPGQTPLFTEMVKDIRAESGLLASGSKDPLTHLYSRPYFDQCLSREMHIAKLAQQHLALLLIDLDDFRQMNETYGQAVGDAILVEVAQVMNLNPSQGKTSAYRYGDDEIAVLITDTSIDSAERIAEWVREQIAQIHLEEVPRLKITVSIGLYTIKFSLTNGSQDVNEATLVAKADAQLYIAKRNGKNRVASAALS